MARALVSRACFRFCFGRFKRLYLAVVTYFEIQGPLWKADASGGYPKTQWPCRKDLSHGTQWSVGSRLVGTTGLKLQFPPDPKDLLYDRGDQG